MLAKLTAGWREVPPEIRAFLKRALLVFVVWKLCYHLFLYNGRVLDKPLTDISTHTATVLLKVIYPSSVFTHEEICNPNPELHGELACMQNVYKDGIKIVGVADPCNALELYVLYVGFLIAFPLTLSRGIQFGLLGIAVIFMANVLRLAALSILNLHHVAAAELAHHYVFKVVVYALIFGLWVLYLKKYRTVDAAV
ncbi:MAG: hypothetical protein KGO81_05345 [Bacteroidota bacterium]|nr:hypothetical protein [Bacteroidota bacterium]